MYIYLSNENESLVEVFFDDLKVEHVKSPVVQADDYYPFGLQISPLSYSRENSLPNRYLYNGKEIQDELDLGWLDYGARMYMPETARWGVLDILANKYAHFSPYNYVLNNPLIFKDPDGKEIYFVTTSGAVIAATEENLKNTELASAYKGIMSTESGRETWNTYAKNDEKDIYIGLSGNAEVSSAMNGLSIYDLDKNNDGIGDKDVGSDIGAIGYEIFVGVDFSNSKDKQIALVSLKKSHFEKNGTEFDKFAQAETVFHEIEAHVRIDDAEKQNHNSDKNHNSFGAKYGVQNWGKGSVSANSPAGKFVKELLNSNTFKLPDWLRERLQETLREENKKK